MGEYDDIINLPHHVSKKHPQMSIQDRAAQFSAFDALTGLKSIMGKKEHELECIEKIELSEELQEKISDSLQSLETGDFVKIKYYKDRTYHDTEEKVLKIDTIKKKIVFQNEMKINFDDILVLEKI